MHIRETPAYRAAVEAEQIEYSQTAMHLKQTLENLGGGVFLFGSPEAFLKLKGEFDKALTTARYQLNNVNRAAKKIQLRKEREQNGVSRV